MKTFAYIKVISDKGYKEAGYRLEITPVEYVEKKEYYQRFAIAKLCISRGWTVKDLQRYGYNKIRVYFREV